VRIFGQEARDAWEACRNGPVPAACGEEEQQQQQEEEEGKEEGERLYLLSKTHEAIAN